LEHWRWIPALFQACDLLICFEDTSGPQLLTATTLFRVHSCVDFLLQQIFPALSLFEFYFGSLLFVVDFFHGGVSNLVHITLAIRSLLIRTTLHFIFIATTLN
jgi:hypothetical protein